ncbi:MAG TPA: hypothetical protein VKN14_06745 [Flavobacteriaceae bacterium]|nr:hypothetical protein [Flavobacteriaceae bacterium]
MKTVLEMVTINPPSQQLSLKMFKKGAYLKIIAISKEEYEQSTGPKEE